MRLFVGNLSFETTEQAVEDAFAAHGTVTDCKLMFDQSTQRSRGFAFVTMGTAQEGQAAIEALNGTQLDGRALNVNEARPREEGGGRRSFGGGGGGGRREFSGGNRGGNDRRSGGGGNRW